MRQISKKYCCKKMKLKYTILLLLSVLTVSQSAKFSLEDDDEFVQFEDDNYAQDISDDLQEISQPIEHETQTEQGPFVMRMVPDQPISRTVPDPTISRTVPDPTISRVTRTLSDLRSRVQSFEGGQQEYKFLDEMLTRLLLDLDGVHSDREARKSAVLAVQETLRLLESKRYGKAHELPPEAAVVEDYFYPVQTNPVQTNPVQTNQNQNHFLFVMTRQDIESIQQILDINCNQDVDSVEDLKRCLKTGFDKKLENKENEINSKEIEKREFSLKNQILDLKAEKEWIQHSLKAKLEEKENLIKQINDELNANKIQSEKREFSLKNQILDLKVEKEWIQNSLKEKLEEMERKRKVGRI